MATLPYVEISGEDFERLYISRAAYDALAAELAALRSPVEWVHDPDEWNDTWTCLGCGAVLVWYDGDPEPEYVKYCSKCGHPIEKFTVLPNSED